MEGHVGGKVAKPRTLTSTSVLDMVGGNVESTLVHAFTFGKYLSANHSHCGDCECSLLDV